MKELLKYQQIDIELKKVEKKVNSSECFKKVNASKEIAKKAQIKMIEVNNEAKKVTEEINKIISVKTKGLELVKKYTETDISNMDENSVLEIVNKLKPIKKNLEELINRLNFLESRMKLLLKEFEDCKQKVITSKKIHDENKVLLDEVRKQFEPEIENVKNELTKQEKNVKPELLQKYKNLKREGVFPVIVKLEDGKNCGYCRVAQSIQKLDKIKLNGYTECEQCHRIILN